MIDSFITNYTEKTFLETLKNSIEKCNSFCFSVSFIKKAGLVLIEKSLEEALQRGVNGRIITSTYQNFTDSASLDTFLKWMEKYPNFKCHLDFMSFGDNGFHSKGYLFQNDDSKECIIGSSNITRYALLKNIEWNLSLKSTNEIKSYNSALLEFESIWNKTEELSQELIDKYKIILDYAIEKWDMDYFNPDCVAIKPNYMQRKALKEIRRYRDMGINRTLVISATGSGKTYLAAFDARNYDAKRLLFIVHRETILKDAMDTFKKVFYAERSYGFFTGNKKELDCDFLFTSTAMMARHLDMFDPHEFDYIVYDEVHHMVAEGGKKIYDFFKPGFLLGLTATPERLDNKDVFELFDQNVPFELRLRDAIINDLVVPFHYFAIRDEFADYSDQIKNKVASEIAKEINVEFIADQVRKHKLPGEKLKCLAFCTNIEHCKTMAAELGTQGFNAVSLTGSNNTGERLATFKALENESNPLEIICTVDILNEGVDIPAVNMVLFLRPTESPTIFIQQLGRGLRKYENKEYVTVLDFIGNNYRRSVQIALALGGLANNMVLEKVALQDMIRTNFSSLDIPGVKIFFDDLSKTEIIKYIGEQNFNTIKFLKQDYNNFKKYLNLDKYPSHMDYFDTDIAPDLIRFMKASGTKRSYYEFLIKVGEEVPSFDEKQRAVINKLSDELPLVRPDEYLIIKHKITDIEIDLDELRLRYPSLSDKTLSLAESHLKYKDINVLDKDSNINCNINDEFKEYILDLVEYGLNKYMVDFADFSGGFKKYCYYKKQQIALMLEREYTMDFKQKGTWYQDGDAYLYVNLNKDEVKAGRPDYKDKFLTPSLFQWESVINTTRTTGDGPKLLKAKRVYLFVKKMDEEDGIKLPYMYFGTGKFIDCKEDKAKAIDSDGSLTEKPTLLFEVALDNEVPKEYWFDYMIEGKEE